MAVVYVGVIPRLEASLRDQKLDSLAAAARSYSPPIRRSDSISTSRASITGWE